ncbi:PAAR-like domain-containing protein [Thalassococcus sp. BH17M4-6]|uniref:PAAR-like domain-containing protein n=1 Tax=Thalassococcus sp. BH17M4-6 TaxID=3413148 RepID=UPI003BC11DA6
MGQPICPTQGIAFAFPDVCLTPAPPSAPIPIPYPNIAQLADAQDVADDLLLGSSSLNAVLADSTVATSSGDEAGSNGGVNNGNKIKGECKVTSASTTVLYGGKGIARFGDPTSQNDGNAVGSLLGAFPTVLVGG